MNRDTTTPAGRSFFYDPNRSYKKRPLNDTYRRG